jgi:hypothetical protein
MTAIPAGTKFHGVAPFVDTKNRKSATLNANADAYTIEDIIAYFQATILGWCKYDDDQYTSSSKLTLVNGAEVKLPNNGATTLKSSPSIDFYDPISGELIGLNENDVYILTVLFKVQTANTNQTHLDIKLSGPPGYDRINESIGFYKGNNVAENIHKMYQYYVDAAFVANGSEIKISSIGSNSMIWDIIFFIQRTQLGS